MQGKPYGAGVLLDDRYVLTCAHVVRQAGVDPDEPTARLRVQSTDCAPEWALEARIAPGTWVHRLGTKRGDVALLELVEPADCHVRTLLWQAPISGGRVRVYGFPRLERNGVGADAELAGAGGREGEWGQLKKVDSVGPWIVKGYSGAGVMALDGEFKDRVIGIVVADYNDEGVQAAWMMPTETILSYLPQLQDLSGGEPGVRLGAAAGAARAAGTDAVLEGPLQLAMTRELTRLLSGGTWAGTAVVGTGSATGAGSSWLVRLARTSDLAVPVAGAEGTGTRAPSDIALGFGAVDGAFDARGRSASEVHRYLARRFGLPEPDGTAAELVTGLLHRRPPACLIVDGIDRAERPEELVTELFVPLARRARSRGMRLVLGFDGKPPDDLAYDVWLDPTPLPGSPAPTKVTGSAAAAIVGRLARAEKRAAELQRSTASRFLAPPRLPPAQAPRLGIRLEVAHGTGPGGELDAVQQRARSAIDDVARYVDAVREMDAEREELGVALELHRVRAARYFGAEDLPLGDLYVAAAGALQSVPVDLAAARRRVPRYIDEVNRRVEAAERTARGEG